MASWGRLPKSKLSSHGNILIWSFFNLDNQFRMSILERLEQMERRMAEMTGSQQHKQGVGGGSNGNGNGGTQVQVRALLCSDMAALHFLTRDRLWGAGSACSFFPELVWFVGVFNGSWLYLGFATASVLLERAGCSFPQWLSWAVCGVSVHFWDWDAGQLL